MMAFRENFKSPNIPCTVFGCVHFFFLYIPGISRISKFQHFKISKCYRSASSLFDRPCLLYTVFASAVCHKPQHNNQTIFRQKQATERVVESRDVSDYWFRLATSVTTFCIFFVETTLLSSAPEIEAFFAREYSTRPVRLDCESGQKLALLPACYHGT